MQSHQTPLGHCKSQSFDDWFHLWKIPAESLQCKWGAWQVQRFVMAGMKRGIYIIIRIRAAGMNRGVIWTSLISQPQKSHLFFMAQWILHTQAGRKITALPNLTVVLKRNAKALDWETKTLLIRIEEQSGNCRCMQQFRIDSLSVYEFEWNWPNLKGIMWIYKF